MDQATREMRTEARKKEIAGSTQDRRLETTPTGHGIDEDDVPEGGKADLEGKIVKTGRENREEPPVSVRFTCCLRV
jgi:hypothetical protein